MTDYESLVHLSRWRQVVIWFCENPIGYGITSILAATALFAPVFLIGAWWMVMIVVAGLAFALGWNAARRRWLRDGRIDKL